MAHRVIAIAQKCLQRDEWVEYYDANQGRLIGREARKFQTWTIAGFLAAQALLDNSEHLALISFDTEPTMLECNG